MPTYEYQCPEGHEFELFQKMTEKPRAKCPVCGRMATRKISGGAGLVFKGTGFYITDYGKDGKGPRKESSERAEKTNTPGDKPTPTTSTSDSTPKADPKPDSAPAKPAKSPKKKAAE